MEFFGGLDLELDELFFVEEEETLTLIFRVLPFFQMQSILHVVLFTHFISIIYYLLSVYI